MSSYLGDAPCRYRVFFNSKSDQNPWRAALETNETHSFTEIFFVMHQAGTPNGPDSALFWEGDHIQRTQNCLFWPPNETSIDCQKFLKKIWRGKCFEESKKQTGVGLYFLAENWLPDFSNSFATQKFLKIVSETLNSKKKHQTNGQQSRCFPWTKTVKRKNSFVNETCRSLGTTQETPVEFSSSFVLPFISPKFLAWTQLLPVKFNVVVIVDFPPRVP